MGFAQSAIKSRQTRVAFEEASTIFGDSLSLTIPDPEHSHMERRHITMGNSV